MNIERKKLSIKTNLRHIKWKKEVIKEEKIQVKVRNQSTKRSDYKKKWMKKKKKCQEIRNKSYYIQNNHITKIVFVLIKYLKMVCIVLSFGFLQVYCCETCD